MAEVAGAAAHGSRAPKVLPLVGGLLQRHLPAILRLSGCRPLVGRAGVGVLPLVAGLLGCHCAGGFQGFCLSPGGASGCTLRRRSW